MKDKFKDLMQYKYLLQVELFDSFELRSCLKKRLNVTSSRGYFCIGHVTWRTESNAILKSSKTEVIKNKFSTQQWCTITERCLWKLQSDRHDELTLMF